MLRIRHILLTYWLLIILCYKYCRCNIYTAFSVSYFETLITCFLLWKNNYFFLVGSQSLSILNFFGIWLLFFLTGLLGFTKPFLKKLYICYTTRWYFNIEISNMRDPMRPVTAICYQQSLKT
jgi:hypothetical protein